MIVVRTTRASHLNGRANVGLKPLQVGVALGQADDSFNEHPPLLRLPAELPRVSGLVYAQRNWTPPAPIRGKTEGTQAARTIHCARRATSSICDEGRAHKSPVPGRSAGDAGVAPSADPAIAASEAVAAKVAVAAPAFRQVLRLMPPVGRDRSSHITKSLR